MFLLCFGLPPSEIVHAEPYMSFAGAAWNLFLRFGHVGLGLGSCLAPAVPRSTHRMMKHLSMPTLMLNAAAVIVAKVVGCPSMRQESRPWTPKPLNPKALNPKP